MPDYDVDVEIDGTPYTLSVTSSKPPTLQDIMPLANQVRQQVGKQRLASNVDRLKSELGLGGMSNADIRQRGVPASVSAQQNYTPPQPAQKPLLDPIHQLQQDINTGAINQRAEGILGYPSKALGAVISGKPVSQSQGVYNELLNKATPGMAEQIPDALNSIQNPLLRVGSKTANTLAGMALDPATYLLGAGAKVAGMSPTAQALAFGVPAGVGAVNQARSGDVEGALASAAAFLAPMALGHALSRYMGRAEAPTEAPPSEPYAWETPPEVPPLQIRGRTWGDPNEAFRPPPAPAEPPIDATLDPFQQVTGRTGGRIAIEGRKDRALPVPMEGKPYDTQPVAPDTRGSSEGMLPAPVSQSATGEGVVPAITPEGRFHGTSKKQSLRAVWEHNQSGNIYGPGFYTTDNYDIASSYKRKGAKAQDKSIEPAVYSVEWRGDNPPNLINLEQPAPQNTYPIWDAVEKELETSLQYKDRPLKDVYKSIIEETGGSIDDAEESFHNIAYSLRSLGYDGFEHIGGRKADSVKHNVHIYFGDDNGIPPVKLTDTKTGEIVHDPNNSNSQLEPVPIRPVANEPLPTQPLSEGNAITRQSTVPLPDAGQSVVGGFKPTHTYTFDNFKTGQTETIPVERLKIAKGGDYMVRTADGTEMIAQRRGLKRITDEAPTTTSNVVEAQPPAGFAPTSQEAPPPITEAKIDQTASNAGVEHLPALTPEEKTVYEILRSASNAVTRDGKRGLDAVLRQSHEMEKYSNEVRALRDKGYIGYRNKNYYFTNQEAVRVTPSPEERQSMLAQIAKEKPQSSGLTKTQETYLRTSLHNAEPLLNENQPVSIDVPGDGRFTVDSPEQAEALSKLRTTSYVKGTGVPRESRESENARLARQENLYKEIMNPTQKEAPYYDPAPYTKNTPPPPPAKGTPPRSGRSRRQIGAINFGKGGLPKSSVPPPPQGLIDALEKGAETVKYARQYGTQQHSEVSRIVGQGSEADNLLHELRNSTSRARAQGEMYTKDILAPLKDPEARRIFERLALDERGQALDRAGVPNKIPRLTPRERKMWDNFYNDNPVPPREAEIMGQVFDAVSKHRSLVQGVIQSDRQAVAGNMPLTSTPSDFFVSLFNDAGQPATNKTGLNIPREATRYTSHSKETKGQGNNYREDYEANIKQSLGDIAKKAGLARFIDKLEAEGFAVKDNTQASAHFDPATQMFKGADGKEYPAVKITHREDFTARGNVKYWVPEPVNAELERVLYPQKPTGTARTMVQKVQGLSTKLQLATLGEVVGHARREVNLIASSPLIQAELRNPNSTATEVLASMAFPRAKVLYDIAHIDFSDAKTREIAIDLIKNGAGTDRPFQEVVNQVNIPGLDKLADFNHHVLFGLPEGTGLSGFDLRARVMLEKMRRVLENDPNGDNKEQMRIVGNMLGQHMVGSQTALVKAIKSVNPFGGTTLPTRIAELKQSFGDHGFKIDTNNPKERTTLKALAVTETLFRRWVGTAIGAMLVGYILTGKTPDENGVPIAIDSDGKSIYAPWDWIDNARSRAFTTMGVSPAQGYSQSEKKPPFSAKNALYGGVNAGLSLANSPLLSRGAGVLNLGMHLHPDSQDMPAFLNPYPHSEGNNLKTNIANTALDTVPLLSNAVRGSGALLGGSYGEAIDNALGGKRFDEQEFQNSFAKTAYFFEELLLGTGMKKEK